MSHTSILIVAHEPIAQALFQCAQHVFSDSHAFVRACDISAEMTGEEACTQIQNVVKNWLLQGSQDGPTAAKPAQQLLILTDIVGATPANAAQQSAMALNREGDVIVKVLAGVNVPMLLRSITYRYEALETLVERALSGGVRGVVEISALDPSSSSVS